MERNIKKIIKENLIKINIKTIIFILLIFSTSFMVYFLHITKDMNENLKEIKNSIYSELLIGKELIIEKDEKMDNSVEEDNNNEEDKIKNLKSEIIKIDLDVKKNVIIKIVKIINEKLNTRIIVKKNKNQKKWELELLDVKGKNKLKKIKRLILPKNIKIMYNS